MSTPAERELRWRMGFFVVATTYVVLLLIQFVTQRLSGFSEILIVVFLAWLLAFILSPLVGQLVRRGMRRGAAIGLVYGGVLIVGGAGLVYVLTAIGSQVGELVDNFPQTRDRIDATLNGWQSAVTIGKFQPDLIAIFRDVEHQVASTGDQMLSRIPGLGVGVIGGLVLVVILSLYMTADTERILARLIQVVPVRYADHVEILERNVSRAFGGFLRAQVLLAGIQALLTLIVVLAAGLPYGILIIGLSTIVMLVPFFGPPLALISPILALAIYAPGWLLVLAPALLIVQTVLVNWLQPRLMREALGMHPILVLIGLLVGAQVAGVWGALFGIPVIAVLNVFFNYFVNLRRIAETPEVDNDEIIEEIRRESPLAGPEVLVALAAERADELHEDAATERDSSPDPDAELAADAISPEPETHA